MAGKTEYTSEWADKICEAISSEVVSLKTLCTREDFPAQSTVYKWLSENKEFSEKYAQAKMMQADMMAEEILEIADNVENDTIKQDIGDGVEIERQNHEWVQRSKLRIDTRKWLMSKLLPKKYGDKIDHTTNGESVNTLVIKREIIGGKNNIS